MLRRAVRLQQLLSAAAQEAALAERLASSSLAGPSSLASLFLGPQGVRAFSRVTVSNPGIGGFALHGLRGLRASPRVPGQLATRLRRAFTSSGEKRNAPKFENYVPKGLGGRQAPKRETPGEGEGSEGAGPTGSRNNMLGLILFAFILYNFIPSGNNATEISFQEFKAKLLATGTVARLEVVNGDVVRVYQKHEEGTPEQPAKFFFRIGSVDSFERRMDKAQQELGTPTMDFVPVRCVHWRVVCCPRLLM